MIIGSVFFAAYCSALLLALFRHPIFGLIAYIAVFYVHPPGRWWSYYLPSLRWSLVAAAVAMLALLLHRSEHQFRPFFRNGFTIGLTLFIVWIMIQSFWMLNPSMHEELITYYVKYLIAIFLIYKCIETEEHLKIFLWTHVLGCFYFGWVAFTTYTGGRFESFGGPGFSDANYAAILVVTAILSAASLLIATKGLERLAVLGVAPFVMNGLITTISRSGFLSLLIGGAMFVFMAPSKYRISIAALGIAGLVAFMSLANETYWERISTILYAGEEVEGKDTGAGRLDLIRYQLEMFQDYPLGCGHRCTATLSKTYMPDDMLTTDAGGQRARSSHNTFMTMLVEQGLPGMVFYLAFLLWLARSILLLRGRVGHRTDSLAKFFPAIAASLFAITISELFVDYLKLEIRLWFVALLMVMLKLTESEPATDFVPHVRSPPKLSHADS